MASTAKAAKAVPAPAPATPSREYLRFEIVDFHCKGLSKTVPARHRDESVYMYSGALAYGSIQRVMVIPEEIGQAGCPNAKLVPDWSTEQVLPWACRAEKGITLRRVYCEMEGLKCGPRALCGRLLAELKAFENQKMELLTGGELEFVMCSKTADGNWEPLFREPEIFTTLQGCKVMDFCYELEHQMLPVGVDIMTMNTEYGEGQVEITFAPRFGIEAADMTATFRLGTKEIAQQMGLRATFMAKPFGISGVGNGGHLNFSIWAPSGTLREAEKGGASAVSKMTSGKTNVFHSPEHGLSSTAKAFLAGVLAHAPALEALCSPTVPCYCRHGNWAPDVANWGYDDRCACVRVKAEKRGPPGSCYMELRMPSSAANPYLVIAGLVAAGLDGLQRKLELPPERQSKEDGATVLPSSLPAALEALEADEYLTNKLGKRFIRWYVDIKKAELKFLDEKLHPPQEASVAATEPSETEIGKAWRELYMEFI
ncbi:unnamed protein product [Cladocopium goreaui]|uniref:Lengsin n=2 Tax=Cladocopium goreaui TaxID=2562237 RepID=A0A9P1CQI5_9DINO|nr:unnamed protein product [Cladocopium goreaui]